LGLGTLFTNPSLLSLLPPAPKIEFEEVKRDSCAASVRDVRGELANASHVRTHFILWPQVRVWRERRDGRGRGERMRESGGAGERECGGEWERGQHLEAVCN